ncbi:MAG: sugar kinase [Actinobacteria bacterium]|nr:sugar kinase [Actinomycetota bacterium]
MSLLVVATYPVEGGRVLDGAAELTEDGRLTIDGSPLPASQGTYALLAAACRTASFLDAPSPHALIAGDIGRGDGTRAAFKQLVETVSRIRPAVVVFHYMQPIMALMRHALAELAGACPDALLVADAGGMYAAKAAGLAPRFELMTPDIGEIGFLADPKVSHPAYVGHHLLGGADFDPAALAREAHENGGSSRVLLIKGAVDHVVEEGAVTAVIDEPNVPALEAIGGTGDTITGLASAFMAAGLDTVGAAICAARANREAGVLMQATPAMSAADLVDRLPEVLVNHLEHAGNDRSRSRRSRRGESNPGPAHYE